MGWAVVIDFEDEEPDGNVVKWVGSCIDDGYRAGQAGTVKWSIERID